MKTLTVVFPVVLLSFVVWLLVKAFGSRKNGKCRQNGCESCILHEGCQIAASVFEKRKSEGDTNE